jgi:hypothetical protein
MDIGTFNKLAVQLYAAMCRESSDISVNPSLTMYLNASRIFRLDILGSSIVLEFIYYRNTKDLLPFNS